MKNLVFRYSTLEVAYQCLAKYKLMHIDKAAPDDSSLDLEFGQAIHIALRAHYSGDDAMTNFNVYWNMIRAKNLRANRYSWEQLNELGGIFIPRFKKMHAHKFKPLYMEETLEMPLEGHIYQGTPDFIGEYEGKLSVVDWKVYSAPFVQKRILTNEQLYGYAALAQYKYKIEIEQLAYVNFIKSEERIQTNIKVRLTKDRLEFMMSNVRSMIRDLTTRKEFPRNPNCNFCICRKFTKEELKGE